MNKELYRYWMLKYADLGTESITDATANEDGILICNFCGEPRQKWKPLFEGEEELFLAPVLCRCASDKQNREIELRRRLTTVNTRPALFDEAHCKQRHYTFANDDAKNPNLTEKMRHFCEHFEEHRTDGSGIMLYSKVNGGGKTYMACAVANELYNQGYQVRFCDIAELRDEMLHGDNRGNFFDRLLRNHLIVLDDLGMESVNAATKEAEYRIINKITENRVPLIVTTNYTPREMTECTDRDRKRVFDRILGNCAMIEVEPPEEKSRRLGKCRALTNEMKKVVATMPGEKC